MSCVMCGGSAARPVLHGTDRLYRTTRERFQLVACSSCGLLRLDPAPADLGRYYPKDYWFAPDESTASRLEEAYRRIVLRDHLAFVERALRDAGESGPILDVGCGGGLFLALLRDHGFPVAGLDNSTQATSTAWHRNGVPAVCGDLAHAPIRAGSCAAITMFHVLEHLPDPHGYLDAAYDLLAPRGRLVVQVPNASCWQFRLLGGAWNGIDIPRHLNDFRARDLEMLLRECGFDVLRRKYFSLRDNPAGLASSIAPGLDPMARRVRRVPEPPAVRLAKDSFYFGLLTLALPFTALEAAFGAGSTVMFEARKVPR